MAVSIDRLRSREIRSEVLGFMLSSLHGLDATIASIKAGNGGILADVHLLSTVKTLDTKLNEGISIKAFEQLVINLDMLKNAGAYADLLQTVAIASQHMQQDLLYEDQCDSMKSFINGDFPYI